MGSTATKGDRTWLVQNLWPDKLLYGAILLILAGGVGILYGLVAAAAGIRYSHFVPDFARVDDFGWSAAMSVAALALAALALVFRRIVWVALGGLAALLSIGPLGVNILLGGGALVFAFRGWREGEGRHEPTRKLAAHEWPDKSLAAAMLLVVLGVTSLLWGLALTAGWLSVTSADGWLGILALITGAGAMVATPLIHRQHAAWPGIAAAIGGIVGLGFGVLGPALGITVLVLLRKADAEGEFDG